MEMTSSSGWGENTTMRLGKVDESKLPDDVTALKAWVSRGYPLDRLNEARKACLEWLRREYGQ